MGFWLEGSSHDWLRLPSRSAPKCCGSGGGQCGRHCQTFLLLPRRLLCTSHHQQLWSASFQSSSAALRSSRHRSWKSRWSCVPCVCTTVQSKECHKLCHIFVCFGLSLPSICVISCVINP